MKNFKIVCASLVLALLSIFSMSSFTTPNAKAFSTYTFQLTSSGWIDVTASGIPAACEPGNFVCAVTLTDDELDDNGDIDPNVEAAINSSGAGTSHGTALSGYPNVIVYKRVAQP